MKNNVFKWLGLCAASSLFAVQMAASNPEQHEKYVPTQENLKSREDFQNDKFGIFIHWGIYSMMGQGEWVMNDLGLPKDEYSKLASGFYPANFNAHDWVAAIKASGAKYITITSRHHDGFSMFHTKQSDYNIVDATPVQTRRAERAVRGVPETGHRPTFLLLPLGLVPGGLLSIGKHRAQSGKEEPRGMEIIRRVHEEPADRIIDQLRLYPCDLV